jgi:hypothetical protein
MGERPHGRRSWRRMAGARGVRRPSTACCMPPPPPPAPSRAALLLIPATSHGDRAKKRDLLDWAGVFLPCVNWLRTYNIRQWLLVRGRPPPPLGRCAVWAVRGGEGTEPLGPRRRRVLTVPCPSPRPLTHHQWDLIAGITVGFMVVPQGMSYATLAGERAGPGRALAPRMRGLPPTLARRAPPPRAPGGPRPPDPAPRAPDPTPPAHPPHQACPPCTASMAPSCPS